MIHESNPRNPGPPESGLPELEVGASRIIHITRVGMVVNVGLTIVKIAVGAVTGSIGLVADGIHSFFDLITDVIVLISTRVGARPPDEEHPWGHGKLETLGALIISIIFCVAGVEISREAIGSFFGGDDRFPGAIALVVASISFVTKEWLYRVSKSIAKSTGSRTLEANAWHHRSDAFSSLAVMAGVTASLLGFGYGDNVAGLLVGIMIVVAGIRFVAGAVSELVEHAADPETLEVIKKRLATIDDVKAWHNVRSRFVGRELFIDLHVAVPRHYTIVEADRVAHFVEDAIQQALTLPSNIMVHVDPEAPPGGESSS